MTIELKIYDEKQKDKIDFSLKLIKHPSGDIHVRAVDEDGDDIDAGTLIIIEKEGTLVLPVSVNPVLGFKLNEHGQIKNRDKDSSIGDHIREARKRHVFSPF